MAAATVNTSRAFSAAVIVILTLVVVLTLLDSADAAAGSKRTSGRRGRGRRNRRGNDKCLESSMAQYKVTFYGGWAEDKFPRMYPTYRPPAQWSKLVGRSHAPEYHMWSEGKYADHALKRFAENGDALLYDAQPQGYQGVLDTFYCDPITAGQGKTSSFIVTDGTHSKVSFVVKMVPSPDWFVGVDGLDLCRRGRWRSRAHVNLRPMDAGTDRGYTFTSPNWPSYPVEQIYKITSKYPDHPASAFLYPEYRKLPRIAYVDFERVAQFHRRGAVSSLKSNPGHNVVVFGPKTSTTTAALTTTSHLLNGTQVAGNASTEKRMPTSFASAAAAVITTSKTVTTVRNNVNENQVKASHIIPNRPDDFVDDSNLTPTQREHRRMTTAPITTASKPLTPVTNNVEIESTVDVGRGRMAALSNEELDKYDADKAEKETAPELDIQAYQHDSARAQDDAVPRHLAVNDGSESVNENARHPVMEAGVHEQQPSTTNAKAAKRNNSANDESFFSVLSSSTVRLQPEADQDTVHTQAAVRLTGEPRTASTSEASSSTLMSSSSSSSWARTQAASSFADTSSPTGILVSLPHTAGSSRSDAILPLGDKDAAYSASKHIRPPPQFAQHLSSASTSIGSTPTTSRTLDTTKVAPHTSSPRQLHQSHQQSPPTLRRVETKDNIRRRQQMRSSLAPRRRSRISSLTPDAAERPDTAEESARSRLSLLRTGDAERPSSSEEPARSRFPSLIQDSARRTGTESTRSRLPSLRPDAAARRRDIGESTRSRVPSRRSDTAGRKEIGGPTRSRLPSPRPNAARRTGAAEPTASQSKHTFDEPQFAEVVVTDQYENSLPVDCRVEDWTEWSPCSMTCGFGVRTRDRNVVSHSRNGGFGCPVLEQETLCGSMRSCQWKHFSFLGGAKRPRRVRRRRRHHHQGGSSSRSSSSSSNRNSNHRATMETRRRYY